MQKKYLKKTFIVGLGLIFLFIVSAGELAHNHLPTQAENASCPAYILSFSIHFEPFMPLITIQPFFQTLIFHPFNYQQPSLTYFRDVNFSRAPPSPSI